MSLARLETDLRCEIFIFQSRIKINKIHKSFSYISEEIKYFAFGNSKNPI